MPSSRLDQLLVQKGLLQTRSRASDFIKRGLVQVNGQIVIKPGHMVSEGADIELLGAESHYVSRGALKLKAALEYFKFTVNDKIALDIGASTGGFTQVLREQGAQKVYAVDVGHRQLHHSILNDAKVVSLEGQDARMLSREHIPEPIDIVTADVSFVSLTHVLPVPLSLCAHNAFLVALVKPQFEVGKKAIGKGGIVRDEAAQQEAVAKVRLWFEQQKDWTVLDVISSPIKGQSGNQEFLLGAQRNG